MIAPGCHRCGECCRKIAFKVAPQQYMLDLLIAHGIIDDTQEEIQLTIWHDCQHLENSGGVSGCKLYGTGKRPQFCRDFMCPRASGKTKVAQIRAAIK